MNFLADMKTEVTLGIALLCGFVCSQTEKRAPPKPEQAQRIVITPLTPEKITRVECWTESATYDLPVEPVFKIVRRTVARGVLYPGSVQRQRPGQGRPTLFLWFYGPGRTALCSVRDDLKALTYDGYAMVRRHHEGLLREVSVSSNVVITYRMTDDDHALLMRIIATALGWDVPKKGVVEDSSPEPGALTPIELTPLFAQDNVTGVTYATRKGKRALPVQPISSILERALRRGAINEEPFKGAIFGWIVVETLHRQFKYRVFNVPEVAGYQGDGVMVTFRIDKADDAQIIETVGVGKGVG